MKAWINQVAQITLINVRNIPHRLGTSLVIVVGIAGVVGVLVSVLAMSEGFRHTLASTGRAEPRHHAALGLGVRAVERASARSGHAPGDAAGVARDAAGRPLASAELVVMVDLPRRGETDPNNVPFRGVQPSAFAIRDEVKIVEGRPFAPRRARGHRRQEGRRASSTASASARPSRFATATGRSSGIFESGGDVHESEIWADAEVAMSAFRRQGFQSLTATARRRLGRPTWPRCARP